ncbi:hypothetical protein OGAPHI_001112 [Ogataea philodendri]|uniref:Uncharacterized protein n=1 Tax=Ogataea philodendri TaxID=1378263 RepID=A0A9P8PEX2_9ASCO|nr:uncharacterized protein OGAPHI_001112 [Ogataea philodendri]KAH3670597.1 hypothetical protein OGAPHI_001112 [Ogataea philodendri]
MAVLWPGAGCSVNCETIKYSVMNGSYLARTPYCSEAGSNCTVTHASAAIFMDSDERRALSMLVLIWWLNLTSCSISCSRAVSLYSSGTAYQPARNGDSVDRVTSSGAWFHTSWIITGTIGLRTLVNTRRISTNTVCVLRRFKQSAASV